MELSGAVQRNERRLGGGGTLVGEAAAASEDISESRNNNLKPNDSENQKRSHHLSLCIPSKFFLAEIITD